MIGGPTTQQNVSPWCRPASVKGTVVSMVGFSPRREGNVFMDVLHGFFLVVHETIGDCDNFEISYVSVHFKVIELFFFPDGLK
jgi:hypothetical protein